MWTDQELYSDYTNYVNGLQHTRLKLWMWCRAVSVNSTGSVCSWCLLTYFILSLFMPSYISLGNNLGIVIILFLRVKSSFEIRSKYLYNAPSRFVKTSSCKEIFLIIKNPVHLNVFEICRVVFMLLLIISPLTWYFSWISPNEW